MSKRNIDYILGSTAIELQREFLLSSNVLLDAVTRTNEVFVDLKSVAPYVFELLQMRNLSSLVSAAFCTELSASSSDWLKLNPHQDGYPDLLLMDDAGRKIWVDLEDRIQQKEPFSPYLSGGIEVKATCGEVLNSREMENRAIGKIGLGDTRVECIRSLNWKSHHRDTNYLLALLWDFREGIPFIAAVLFSNNLTHADWGKITVPKDGGGRTTSVSVMNRQGVGKLVANTVIVVNDQKYLNLLKRFNPNS